ncbi:MAG: DUF4157 domain-containing protein [Burkholderiaceae bacterium]|nr:DUF4157 domain-containing protein [Burkholderiaceae bacterium]
MKPTLTHRPASTTQAAGGREATSHRHPSRHGRPGVPMYLQGGHALAGPTRTRLESGFGRPLDQIRVHDDARAGQLNDALDADAFTLGAHVYLGADQSSSRLDLLAHEVAHALQQSGAPAGGALRTSRPGDAGEQAAERAAQRIPRGLPAQPGPAVGLQIARQPRGGSKAGLSEEALEDLAAIGEPPSPMIRLSTDPPYEVQLARYQRGKARQKAREADNEQRIQSEQATWEAGVVHDEIEAATRIEGPSDLGRVLLGGMRWNQANIRRGGDDIEQWLKEKQEKGRSEAYQDADQHADDWYGPLLRAGAVFHDMSSEFTTGVARGGVTLGSGLLGAVANPVDTVGGLLELGNDLVNPFADRKELNAAAQGIAKPYAEAIGEGRYLEAGGRLFFDVASMLVGGELGAGSKGARGTTVVDDLARTLPAGDDLARTLPAGDDLARTVPAGDDLARTLPAADDLAHTQPGRPYPTEVMPGSPLPVYGQQWLKFESWMDDFFRPQKARPSGSRPVPAAAGEVEAAAQARAPVVTHLSESFHRNIWDSIGGKGDPPVAFRHNDVLFVDYERLSPAMRQAIDQAKEARSPGSWTGGGAP